MYEVVDEDPPWSMYEKDPLTALIDSQAGIIAVWQAARFVTRQAIQHRANSGRWRRVARGVYATYGGPLNLRQQQWIAVLSAGPSLKETGPVVIGGISALQVHGLRNVTSDRVHLVVGQHRKATARPGVTVHRSALVEDDLHPYSRPPTTTIGRAVVDAAAWAHSDDEARLVIVASFQQRLVTAPEIRDVLDRMPTVKRRQLVTETTRDAAGGSHSIGELHFVGICRDFHLPMPTRQVRFIDSSGRTRYLDAVFDPWRYAVEVDGAHHSEDVVQRWDDIGRDGDLLSARFRVMRLTVAEVRHQRASVARKLRAGLMSAGWRPQDS